jgi:hypothetical protein
VVMALGDLPEPTVGRQEATSQEEMPSDPIRRGGVKRNLDGNWHDESPRTHGPSSFAMASRRRARSAGRSCRWKIATSGVTAEMIFPAWNGEDRRRRTCEHRAKVSRFDLAGSSHGRSGHDPRTPVFFNGPKLATTSTYGLDLLDR